MRRATLLLGLLALVVISGCGADRKFLQMDSNSRSPFMGLEFRVDADRAADGSRSLAEFDTVPGRSNPPDNRNHAALTTFRAQSK